MEPKRLLGGLVGGIAGGVLFGMMMQMMGMLSMVGGLVNSDSVMLGWVVHLAISAALGVGFALTLGAAATSWGRALAAGGAYGVVWWILGALLLMPLRMGMPAFEVGQMQLQSLVGHVLYGLVLGAVFYAVAHATADRRVASRA
jgi:hypothetical protein